MNKKNMNKVTESIMVRYLRKLRSRKTKKFIFITLCYFCIHTVVAYIKQKPSNPQSVVMSIRYDKKENKAVMDINKNGPSLEGFTEIYSD